MEGDIPKISTCVCVCVSGLFADADLELNCRQTLIVCTGLVPGVRGLVVKIMQLMIGILLTAGCLSVMSPCAAFVIVLMPILALHTMPFRRAMACQ